MCRLKILSADMIDNRWLVNRCFIFLSELIQILQWWIMSGRRLNVQMFWRCEEYSSWFSTTWSAKFQTFWSSIDCDGDTIVHSDARDGLLWYIGIKTFLKYWGMFCTALKAKKLVPFRQSVNHHTSYSSVSITHPALTSCDWSEKGRAALGKRCDPKSYSEGNPALMGCSS